MKQQPYKSARQVALLLSANESHIMSNALDFSMIATEYSSVDPAFSHESAFSAVEKIEGKAFSFTRSEIRSMVASIDYFLVHMDDESVFISDFEEDFPGVIALLKESPPALKSLRARLSAAAAKLSRQK